MLAETNQRDTADEDTGEDEPLEELVFHNPVALLADFAPELAEGTGVELGEAEATSEIHRFRETVDEFYLCAAAGVVVVTTPVLVLPLK